MGPGFCKASLEGTQPTLLAPAAVPVSGVYEGPEERPRCLSSHELPPSSCSGHAGRPSGPPGAASCPPQGSSPLCPNLESCSLPHGQGATHASLTPARPSTSEYSTPFALTPAALACQMPTFMTT